MALELFDQHITPAELTGYAREGLQDRPENQLVLSALLPDKPINDLTYKFSQGNTEGLVEAASYRAFDAEPTFGARAGITERMGSLPPIGRQYVLGEYDSLRLRNADQEVRDLLLRDALRITRAIDWRLEFARAQALVEGRVTIAEDHIQAEVVFGRSGTHSVVPATVLWTNAASAVPLDDLMAWRDIYVATNGQQPGQIWTSTRVVTLLAKSAQMLSFALPVGSTVGRIRESEVQAILAEFGLPPITKYDAVGKNVGGSTTRLIPDDKLLMLPPAGDTLGATLYGATAESQQPEYGLAGGQELGGIVVGSFINKPTPIRVHTVGSAIAIPILGNPDLSLIADVA
jgi:hypothetical protein